MQTDQRSVITNCYNTRSYIHAAVCSGLMWHIIKALMLCNCDLGVVRNLNAMCANNLQQACTIQEQLCSTQFTHSVLRLNFSRNPKYKEPLQHRLTKLLTVTHELTVSFMCSDIILYTLSSESTLAISSAERISPSSPTSPLLRRKHRTVGPLPFCLASFWNVAGRTLTASGEGASEANACMRKEVETNSFSLFFLLGCDT
ncbi:hypothetical protein ACHAWF_008576 [Thalassiosira exigua]